MPHPLEVPEQLIKQCANNLSRENIIKQAKNFSNVTLPVVVPAIKIKASDKTNMNYTQMRLQRWTSTRWELISDVPDTLSE